MFRTVIATLVLSIVLSQGAVAPALSPQGCPPGFYWDPRTQQCQPVPQQAQPPTPPPQPGAPPIVLPGVPSFGPSTGDSSRRGRFNDLPPLPQPGQGCRLNFYWSGVRCISYDDPDKCVRGWTFDWRTYTCKAGTQETQIACSDGRYFNGVLCADRPSRGTPVCVPGWIWSEINDRCFKLPPGPDTCTAGQIFNGAQCVAPPTAPVPNDFCKNSWTWYATKSICTPPTQSNQVCTGGYFNGQSCTSYRFPNRCIRLWTWDVDTYSCIPPAGHNQCPDRYYWNGEACLPVTMPNECITNWEWDFTTRTCKDNTRIVCISGYFNGKRCIPFSSPNQCQYGWNWVWSTYTCEKDLAIRCDRGEYYNGEECLRLRGQPQCIDGWTYDEDRRTCIRQRAVDPSICPSGFKWDGTACKTSNTCAANYELQDGWCVQIRGTCPKGQYWSQADRNCLLITSTSCPATYYFDGRVCALINDAAIIQVCTSTQFRWAFASNSCVPVGSNSGTATPTCRNGRVWNGTECIECNWPRYWNGVECSRVQPPLCALGTWNGRICS